jgi:uncharacterized membrane protein
MSVSQPPSDAPFGLQPNVAMGLAYLLQLLGGIIFLVGGGTNKSVKFAAAQSLTFWVIYYILYVVVIPMLGFVLHGLVLGLWGILGLIALVVWIWTTISGFQGKEVRIPGVADITANIFKSAV